jgi:hypothetical protein
MNKNLMIGLGVLAVAGIAYYMYKKPKATTTTGEEPKAGATGKPKMGTVRNPIPSPVSSVKPCGGATYMGYYKCCYSGGGGVAGYSNNSDCSDLIKWVG